MAVNLDAIDAAIRAVCPITGLVFNEAYMEGEEAIAEGRRIIFADAATLGQRAAAQALFDAWTPVAPIVPLVPALYAVAQLTIAAGAISGIDIASKLAGGFILDVGQYYMLFTDQQPDTSYLAKAYNGESKTFIREADKFTDGFIITVVDNAGAPVDVTNLSLEIIRVG